MRVLITTDWYVPAVNGVVTSVLNLTDELTALGHEVRVLTLSPKGRAYQEGNVYYVPSISGEMVYKDARIGPVPDLLTLNRVEQWRPDIIHTQCELSTFIWAQVLAHHYHVPIVHTYHTIYEYYTHYVIPSERIGQAMVRKLSQFVLARTSMVIVPTQKVKRLLQGYGVTRPIRVAPTGIRLDRFLHPDPAQVEALRAQLKLPRDRLILLTAGRVTEEKNMHGLLHMLAQTPAPQPLLLVVGDGPYRPRLEQQAQELGLAERVVFTGLVPPEQMPLYYALGEVYVGASQSETQGLTYVEAMAAGLPMLCRRDGALEGLVIDGENGWQIDDTPGFAARLAQLDADPALRRRMGQCARKTAVEGWSTEVFARRVLAVYEEALALPPRVRRGRFAGIFAHLPGPVQSVGAALKSGLKNEDE